MNAFLPDELPTEPTEVLHDADQTYDDTVTSPSYATLVMLEGKNVYVELVSGYTMVGLLGIDKSQGMPRFTVGNPDNSPFLTANVVKFVREV
jgi:hypothetical protein